MLSFERGTEYTRPDVKERAGLRRDLQGGNWDTGVVEHDGEFLIFANVGTEGRTGHNYGNLWEGRCLRWYHKARSQLGWKSVQALLERDRRVHVFWRISNQAAFKYAGLANAIEVADTSPVQIIWSFEPTAVWDDVVESPEEISRLEYREGAVHEVLVNVFERNRAGRQACIDHFGPECAVCGLQFDKRYGPLGAGFIHVHHVIPLSELGADYSLNPTQDLRPVCPNCHVMLHRRRPPLSVADLRQLLRE